MVVGYSIDGCVYYYLIISDLLFSYCLFLLFETLNVKAERALVMRCDI